MRIIPVPCRSDNYAYIVIDETSNKAAVVDPYDVPKVVNAAGDAGVEIVGALTTHHHNDHCGGNKVSRPFYLDRATEGIGTGIGNDPIAPV
jgi:hydroxyacylglutathione hydrolase